MWHATPFDLQRLVHLPHPLLTPQQQNGPMGVSLFKQCQCADTIPPPRLLIKSRCLRNADSSSQVPYTSPTGCISQFSVSPLFPSSLIQPTFAPCLSTHLNPSCQHSLNLSPSSPMLQPIRTILLIPGHGLDDDHLLFDLKVD